MIFPEEIWTLIKDFMPTWKENHSRKLNQSLKKSVENNMYQYSIVSDDKKLSLFVLARNVSEFYEKYDTTVLKKLDTLGFNTFINKPIPSNQDNCSYP